MSMGANEAGGGRLLSSLQGLSATLIAIIHTRLELLAVEVQEEKQRMMAALGWAALAVLMGTVACVFMAGFITVLFWEHHPLIALGALTLLFAGICVVAARRVKSLIHDASQGLLVDSLAELKADHEALMQAAGRGRAASSADAFASDARE